ARFQPNSLYNQSIVYTSLFDTSSEMYAPTPPYRRVGNIYDLQPFDEPIKDGVQVSLEAPDFYHNLKGLGLYYWDFKKGWLFIPSRIDSSQMSFTARVTSLEKFTLIQDTIPPIIASLQPAPGGHISTQTGKISFTLKDEMSGIQREYQIVVRVKGQWHLFDYDPEEDTISLTLSHQEMREAQLQIEVVDNVGNRTRQNFVIN
ncbi:MAG: hypothetical protein ACK2TU_02100, partial [Anaerolineales bacterium]